MYDNELEVGITSAGIILKIEKNGTSVASSSHVESNWRLNELTEEAVTIEVGSLFQ